jgi:hypothetical protein
MSSVVATIKIVSERLDLASSTFSIRHVNSQECLVCRVLVLWFVLVTTIGLSTFGQEAINHELGQSVGIVLARTAGSRPFGQTYERIAGWFLLDDPVL